MDLRAELAKELRDMRSVITDEILRSLQEYVDGEVQQINKRLSSIEKSVKQLQRTTGELREKEVALGAELREIAASGGGTNNQLALTPQQTQALTVATTKQAAAAVMAEVNRVIVPRVKALSEAVAYHTQDTGELITDYRRAVMAASDTASNRLTDGRENGGARWSDGHVGVLWGENESDL